MRVSRYYPRETRTDSQQKQSSLSRRKEPEDQIGNPLGIQAITGRLFQGIRYLCHEISRKLALHKPLQPVGIVGALIAKINLLASIDCSPT